MTEWITLNLSTIIISLLILGISLAIVASIVKKKKSGQTSCGCGCSGCAMKNSCHENK